MKKLGQKSILFLCTGNYYRSRFAEIFFNSVAIRMGLPWKAASRGLALERGAGNKGPMAKAALEIIEKRGIYSQDVKRLPIQVTEEDFEQAERIIALKEAEHRPLLAQRFPNWVDKVEYWHIDDAPQALQLIEEQVMELTARLLGGGNSPQAEERLANIQKLPTTVSAKPKPVPIIRVSRETKGRRGKGVTIVSDVPLDDKGICELAATLKQRCGTGGTVKERHIEIQGDQRDRLTEILESMGFKVKRVGG